VPETATLNHVLRAFQRERRHMAMVVDEYGGIQGIITLEDLLEEIVGEIDDEMDSEEAHLMKAARRLARVPRQSPTCAACSPNWASTRPASTARPCRASSPSGLGGVPQAGQQLDFGGFRFRGAKASNKRAERVVIAKAAPPEPVG